MSQSNWERLDLDEGHLKSFRAILSHKAVNLSRRDKPNVNHLATVRQAISRFDRALDHIADDPKAREYLARNIDFLMGNYQFFDPKDLSTETCVRDTNDTLEKMTALMIHLEEKIKLASLDADLVTEMQSLYGFMLQCKDQLTVDLELQPYKNTTESKAEVHPPTVVRQSRLRINLGPGSQQDRPDGAAWVKSKAYQGRHRREFS